MIFCVEDDASIRDLIIYTLESTGFQAEGFESGEEMFKAMNKPYPELIMLDIMLPGEDGLAILAELKRNQDTKDIPVIMATAKGTEYDTVQGLDAGADDYLAKPFGMMEMVSRIKAVLRRTRNSSDERVLVNGRLVMDLNEHSVTSDGENVILTLKEYELLRCLMMNMNKVLSRQVLLNLVWGRDYDGMPRTVDVHMGTLRTKLGRTSDCIKTIRGVGYRMEESDD